MRIPRCDKSRARLEGGAQEQVKARQVSRRVKLWKGWRLTIRRRLSSSFEGTVSVDDYGRKWVVKSAERRRRKSLLGKGVRYEGVDAILGYRPPNRYLHSKKKAQSLTPNNKLLLRVAVSHSILKLWLWGEKLSKKRRYEKEHE